jgi:solute carrier family 8 (sodium/calcium exchanger)
VEICCPNGPGSTFVPPLFEPEQQILACIVYLVLLLWTFTGVAIVSDIFMSAIEVITSKELVNIVKDEKGEPRKIRAKLWNDTVANLTLMALGSSAPEILLSVIELLRNKMFSGELGPATVVGSAAFNLFVISAICVYSIPDGEGRLIIGTNVYMITSSCSIFAYAWLYLIADVFTKNLITIPESIATLLMFPALVAIAWAVDVDLCFQKKRMASAQVIGLEIEKEGLATAKEIAELRKQMITSHPGIGEEKLMKLVAASLEAKRPKSRAHYKVAAIRNITGGHKLKAQFTRKNDVGPFIDEEDDGYTGGYIGWEAICYSVLEAGEPDPDSPGEFTGYVTIMLSRTEHTCDVGCTVYYKTEEGDGALDEKTGKPRGIAKATEDYLHSEGVVEFSPGELTKEVKIKIIDDDTFEDDEDFYCVLTDPECSQDLRIRNARTRITIIDDDDPGQLQFTQDDYVCTEGQDEYATVWVERVNGSSGEVTCTYRTEDRTATMEKDYEAAEGTLSFDHSETKKSIMIKVHDDEAYEKSEIFRVILENATGGATFTESTDGGKETAICEVTIRNNSATLKKVNAIEEMYKQNVEANKVGTANWVEQFTAAIYVNGSAEDQAAAGCMDWIMHLVTVPFKLAFAIIPPTEFANGWLCFWFALGMIGLITALVGDFASYLGCSLGIPDDVTAITLVALGTSLPDTFASMAAAQQDPYADASVGNVMGSNSVNVFLGLGLPWSMGSIYWACRGTPTTNPKGWAAWKEYEFRGTTYEDLGYMVDYPDGGFIVPAGSLGFSVMTFTLLAFVCIAALAFRRKVFGYELGGPRVPKIISSIFLFTLWLIYLAISINRSMNSSTS